MEFALNTMCFLLFISLFYITGKDIEKKHYAKAGLRLALGISMFILWIGPLEINITNHVYIP